MRQTTEHRTPVRSCIGCRSRRPQSALVRITRSSTGFDIDGPSRGRGAWLCRGDATAWVDVGCFDAAVRARAFGRAWRTELTADDIETLRRLTNTTRIDLRNGEGMTTGKG